MTPNGDNITIPTMSVTFLERTPDGSGAVFFYRPPQAIAELLMIMLGEPAAVMHIPASQIDSFGEATMAPGVEVWTPDDDHMPEAMWPPEQRWPDDSPGMFGPLEHYGDEGR